MSECHIDEKIIIEDVETVLVNLQNISKRNHLTMEEIAEFVREETYTKFYLDEKMNIRKETDYGNKYLWLDTGYQVPDGKPIFISLLPSGEEYSGYFVGTAPSLAKKISERYPQYRTSINKNLKMFPLKYRAMLGKRKVPHLGVDKQAEEPELKAASLPQSAYVEEAVQESAAAVMPFPEMDSFEPETSMAEAIRNAGMTITKNAIYEPEIQIHEVLQNPEPLERVTQDTFEDYDEYEDLAPKKIEEWVQDLYDELLINTWQRTEGLDRFLKIIGTRIQQLIDKKKTEYYIMNRIRSVVINTGLVDKFGSDVLVYYKINRMENGYKAYNVVMSKTELLAEGFSVQDIKRELKPIQFNDEPMVLMASLSDFDINYRSLAHIVNERIDRFPDIYQDMKSDVLAAKIKSALEIGLKLQQRDHNYAKPVYSTRQMGISWYMPLHIHKSLSEAPELVMVIKKVEEFYQVKTILNYDDNIKDRITAMALYGNSW